MENRIITEDGMVVYCAHTKMVEVDSLIPNPKNPNKHLQVQIDLLAKIMVHQGVRRPIIVSRRSGFIVCGHGRLEAIKKNNWKWAPVDYQDYENEALEYADMVADNKIAELAEFDMGQVNVDFTEFGPFDVDLLGIPDFKIEPLDKLDPIFAEDLERAENEMSLIDSVKEELERRKRIINDINPEENVSYWATELILSTLREEEDESIISKYKKHSSK